MRNTCLCFKIFNQIIPLRSYLHYKKTISSGNKIINRNFSSKYFIKSTSTSDDNKNKNEFIDDDTDDIDEDDEVDESNIKESLRLKVRQHVNPLSLKYQKPIILDNDWMFEAFEDPINKPLIIDVGCAKGLSIPYNQ